MEMRVYLLSAHTGRVSGRIHFYLFFFHPSERQVEAHTHTHLEQAAPCSASDEVLCSRRSDERWRACPPSSHLPPISSLPPRPPSLALKQSDPGFRSSLPGAPPPFFPFHVPQIIEARRGFERWAGLSPLWFKFEVALQSC